jgi:hypothetical protein
MRCLLFLAVTAIPVLAQSPTLRISNMSRAGSTDFQVGDRFEIVISAAPNQPVSVRTARMAHADWGPIIGWTDSSGRWSTTGQFEKNDFGDWNEVWTVGGKLANPVVQFPVGAPCLKDGHGFLSMSGPNTALLCDTAWGPESFRTPSDPDPFRTPDGRLIAGRERSSMTADQYQAEIMQYSITSHPSDIRNRELGDAAGALIAKIIGVNALTEEETRNVLSVLHAAFEKPDGIPVEARDPSATVLLLLNLENSASEKSLKQQIAETLAFVQAQ